ncbi:pyridoxamine 5'-phosphate oxidase family protein, partial [Streptomyces sp. NPDC050428]|uniref:pyridoxamine 5'-phosphate oxidase family protein n=1 Tax=Streptomyces sp. NPDC050428 TaxID=3155757 RepID=UPI003424FAF5
MRLPTRRATGPTYDSQRRSHPREPAEYLAFWHERHLSTLTTLRPDGTPHVVPVGVT